MYGLKPLNLGLPSRQSNHLFCPHLKRFLVAHFCRGAGNLSANTARAAVSCNNSEKSPKAERVNRPLGNLSSRPNPSPQFFRRQHASYLLGSAESSMARLRNRCVLLTDPTKVEHALSDGGAEMPPVPVDVRSDHSSDLSETAEHLGGGA